jgi:spore germination protein YaaH
LLLLCSSLQAQNIENPVQGTALAVGSAVAFDEIWGYLMKGGEHFSAPKCKITDLCYFAATVNNFGKLVEVPDRSKIQNFNGRVHLCLALVVEGNKAVTHFALDPKLKIRKKLIKDIVKATEKFDGLQIDFEKIAERDAENFYSFLKILKKKLKKKTLSVAVFAKSGGKKEVNNCSKTPYDYERISKIVDKVIVMAYDEHYGLSKPGPIASVKWAKQVAKYSTEHIAVKKLVMGLPFYGRAWGSINPSRAYKHSSILQLIKDRKISKVEVMEGVPSFTYKENIDVVVYFENRDSIMQKAKMYHDLGIRNLAFWCLGQEDPKIWKEL